MAGDGTWTVVSALPECDIHKYEKGEPGVEARYDGKTIRGPWANMCEPCFGTHGIGLGTGLGQRLILRGEAEYGEVSATPGKVCKECAAVGWFTWLNPDGTCRRADKHRTESSHSRESDGGWWCFICGQAKDDGPHRDTAHEPHWVKEDSKYAGMSDADVLREIGMTDAADALEDEIGKDF